MGVAVVAAMLVAYALTSNSPEASPLPAIELGSPIAFDERSEIDQLRDLCKLEWPAAVADGRDEEARRKACRAFGGSD
jgi:hypothetical protein